MGPKKCQENPNKQTNKQTSNDFPGYGKKSQNITVCYRLDSAVACGHFSTH